MKRRYNVAVYILVIAITVGLAAGFLSPPL